MATTRAQRALSVQVQDNLPDALALPLCDLGDRDPSHLLTCWELLLGRGYTTSLNRSENKEYLLLHRHPWMAYATTIQADAVVSSGPLMHALHELDDSLSRNNRPSIPNELSLMDAALRALPRHSEVTPLWCSHRAMQVLKQRFDTSATDAPRFRGYIAMALKTLHRPTDGTTTDAATALRRLRCDRHSWALLMSLHDALHLGVFQAADLHTLVCHDSEQAYVWVSQNWPGLQQFEYQHPGYRPPGATPKDHVLLAMASLTPVNPCAYPNILAAHQRGITAS